MQSKSFLKFFFLILMLFGLGNVYAAKLECPSVDAIKNMNFLRAAFNDDNNSWNFWSAPFSYQGKEWNVWFMSSLPEADKYPVNPLEDAKKAYAKAKVMNEHPEPKHLDSLGVDVCTYSHWPQDQVGIMAFNPSYYP
jgi:hypothetical protein